MRIGTLNQGLDIYIGLTRTGNIALQFVLNGDFQNAPKVFLNAEESEKLIAAFDIFLAKKPIQKPIAITNMVKGNNIQVMTQNEQFLILLTTAFGNTNIYLSRLQSIALKRFLMNWPIYGTIQTMMNAMLKFNGQNSEQMKTQFSKQKNYQTNLQTINNTSKINQSKMMNNTQFNSQMQSNTDEQPMIQQDNQIYPEPDDILNELDDLIKD